MKVKFSKKPIPIPAEYRPIYKVSQLVLVLHLCCRGRKSSLMKMHLFSWALKDFKNREVLISLTSIDYKYVSTYRWSIEPSVNRALDFMVAERICDMDAKNFVLTDFGEELAKQILEDEEVLARDKAFLTTVGKKITEGKVTELTNFWLNL